jgi:Zn-dependent protease
VLSWLRSTLSRPLLQGQLLPSEHVPTLCGAALCALAPVQGRLDSGTIGILEVVFVVTFIVISLALHEAAHAWVAWKCGDPTAKDLGRITLNPIASIDPFLTIILPGALMLMGQPPFGGAKPVPVTYHRLRHPLRDMMLVALAGPATNFLLSIVFLLALKLSYTFGDYRPGDLMFGVLQYAVFANLMLTVFNLLPVPPLDGSRVMAWLLPSGLREPYQDLERFGMLLVVGIMAAMNYIPGLRRAVWDGALALFNAIDFLTGGLW